ncbi:MAG: thioredoxin family protein [Dehalococcoidia bacterium]|nr:thioredoxin family protein [Dehalococcoidia bacterium]
MATIRLALLGCGIGTLAALFASCGSSDEGGASGGARDDIAVSFASYEPLVGANNRIIVGLLTNDNNFISYGDVSMRFFRLGAQNDPPQFVSESIGRFIPVPGEGAAALPSRPTVVPPSGGRGVYEALGVNFDRAGYWRVEVTANLSDGARAGAAAFQVQQKASLPNVGDQAIASLNPIIGSDAPGGAIDSRFVSDGKIPDPELHSMTIADAIRSGKPTLVVFATPVFCVSRFCGPVTDMVQEIEREFRGRANVIHVEIWNDFQKKAINKAAADWIYRGDNLTEPWFFLIGKDGKIAARWDNLASREQIVQALQQALR